MELTREIRDKRVAIAKDVLAQLDAKAYELRSGYRYFSAQLACSKSSVIDQDLRDVLPKAKDCTVCLLGAVLVSKARLYDEVPVASDSIYFGYDAESCVLGLGSHDVYQALETVFDSDSLAIMEGVFERLYDAPDRLENFALREQFSQWRDYFYWFDSSEARVREMMRILIDNDGELALPVKLAAV